MPKFTNKPNNNNSIDKLCSRVEALSITNRITSNDIDQLISRIHSLTLNETKSIIQQKLHHKRNKKMVQAESDMLLNSFDSYFIQEIKSKKDIFSRIFNKRKRTIPCQLEFVMASKKYYF
ncbi:hypothetical protein K502DRAFT_325772 [Neoconidiobolus thromboides FSU 785]|nr:hypothetical protein K502DRAFT_325772 [Neoconidiobolus thromboides FSU 785]